MATKLLTRNMGSLGPPPARVPHRPGRDRRRSKPRRIFDRRDRPVRRGRHRARHGRNGRCPAYVLFGIDTQAAPCRAPPPTLDPLSKRDHTNEKRRNDGN